MRKEKVGPGSPAWASGGGAGAEDEVESPGAGDGSNDFCEMKANVKANEIKRDAKALQTREAEMLAEQARVQKEQEALELQLSMRPKMLQGLGSQATYAQRAATPVENAAASAQAGPPRLRHQHRIAMCHQTSDRVTVIEMLFDTNFDRRSHIAPGSLKALLPDGNSIKKGTRRARTREVRRGTSSIHFRRTVPPVVQSCRSLNYMTRDGSYAGNVTQLLRNTIGHG